MSLLANITKARRYVPIAHFVTAALLLVAAGAADSGQLWFIIAAVLSIAAGAGFYVYMGKIERKLRSPVR